MRAIKASLTLRLRSYCLPRNKQIIKRNLLKTEWRFARRAITSLTEAVFYINVHFLRGIAVKVSAS